MSQQETASGNHAERNIGMGSDRYDSTSSSIANEAADYDVKTNVAGSFTNVKKAYYTEIRTSANISVKLNADSNAAIVINSADSPYIIDQVAITNIFVSNASGGASTVRIFCV